MGLYQSEKDSYNKLETRQESASKTITLNHFPGEGVYILTVRTYQPPVDAFNNNAIAVYILFVGSDSNTAKFISLYQPTGGISIESASYASSTRTVTITMSKRGLWIGSAIKLQS